MRLSHAVSLNRVARHSGSALLSTLTVGQPHDPVGLVGDRLIVRDHDYSEVLLRGSRFAGCG